jgi:pimeloyl-ACP methyl ester carboxylesterase/quercetin dioxygenase-like cupin family protein
MVFIASAWLDSRMWEFQIPYLADHGFRCIAYDRRGHGRSDSPWSGYDYDTLAGDLGALLDELDLHGVSLVSHSAGCGEIVRYLTRQGPRRVANITIVSGTAPCLMKRADNPDGIDMAVVQADLATRTADRPKWFSDNAAGFFGGHVPGIAVSPEFTAFVRRQCLDCTARATAQFFLTGFTADLRDELRAITLPTMIVHGDRDIQAPLDLCGRKTAQLVPQSSLRVYANAAHGLFVTHAHQLNDDLLAFAGASRSALTRRPLLAATLAESKAVTRVHSAQIEFLPAQPSGPHSHPVPVVGLVTAGTFTFQVNGEPVRELKAGDAFYEPANVRVVRFDNASNREPASIVAFYLMGNDDHELITVFTSD